MRGTTYLAELEALCLFFLSACPVRGTTNSGNAQKQVRAFSIRVPREGHDGILTRLLTRYSHFLSACPVRGTTSLRLSEILALRFSIRVPREGHDGGRRSVTGDGEFSIRVPREGHDRIIGQEMFPLIAFLSACPVRGTTP